VDFTNNEYGAAPPVFPIAGPGLTVTPNISILEVNCSFMAQMVIEADEETQLDRTLVVRIQTPGTTGDNFGLYVRNRGSKINPSSDPAPAKAWFEFSNPKSSNPLPSGERGKCLRGMCDGIYGNSLPAIAGSMWETRVPLGWYISAPPLCLFSDDGHGVRVPLVCES
jgi:hypothetical protein